MLKQEYLIILLMQIIAFIVVLHVTNLHAEEIVIGKIPITLESGYHRADVRHVIK